MKKVTDFAGGGTHVYSAPDVLQTVIAVERGFAGSITVESFFDNQGGITGADYDWSGGASLLDGEFE